MRNQNKTIINNQKKEVIKYERKRITKITRVKKNGTRNICSEESIIYVELMRQEEVH